MTILRQFLTIQALLVWQGGFLFYASFVVPVGTELLGGSFEQGRITREVSITLNMVGAIALAVLVWDVLASGVQYRKSRWIAWGVMSVGLVGLVLIHPRMDELIDFDSREISDHRRFNLLHGSYLWISTFQWLAGMVYTVQTLRAWRNDARLEPNPQPLP